MKKTRCVVTVCVILLYLSSYAPAEDWPHWRGPEANGVSREQQLPVRWSTTENIAWKAKLAGGGMSTPITWGDRIFVTSQIGAGIVEARSARYEGPTPASDDVVTFVVQCFSRSDGKLVWEERV